MDLAVVAIGLHKHRLSLYLLLFYLVFLDLGSIGVNLLPEVILSLRGQFLRHHFEIEFEPVGLNLVQVPFDTLRLVVAPLVTGLILINYRTRGILSPIVGCKRSKDREDHRRNRKVIEPRLLLLIGHVSSLLYFLFLFRLCFSKTSANSTWQGMEVKVKIPVLTVPSPLVQRNSSQLFQISLVLKSFC